MKTGESNGTVLLQVIESNLRELKEMSYFETADEWSRWYASILKAYFSGDVISLEHWISTLPGYDHPSRLSFELLAVTRLKLCRASYDENILLQLSEQVAKEENQLLRGELLFLKSAVASYLGNHLLAKESSLQSAFFLRKAGARKKEVGALMNALAEETCLNPEKRYIGDYLEIVDKATAAGDMQSVGCCFYNISCELRNLGALEGALSYAQKAFLVLQNEIAGRLFFSTIAHRCELLCMLDRKFEAQTDLELLLASPFPETVEQRLVLETRFPILKRDRHAALEKSNFSSMNWRERLGFAPGEKFGKFEEKLIVLLLEKKWDRTQLVQILYGTDIPFEHSEARFKNLLMRVRKRVPGSILYNDGQFTLQIDSELLKSINTNVI